MAAEAEAALPMIMVIKLMYLMMKKFIMTAIQRIRTVTLPIPKPMKLMMRTSIMKQPSQTTTDLFLTKSRVLRSLCSRATEASKYNFDQNPLINRDRQQNKGLAPSFNIDDTGFVRAGTKIADLKKKTLAFYTADNFAAWSYRNEKGVTIDEWEWFSQLKKEYGLTIKYTKSQHMKSTESALQAMNAGKPCDIIYSNHVVFPSSLCITRHLPTLSTQQPRFFTRLSAKTPWIRQVG